MDTGSQISKPFALAMKRAKWLGEAAATLKKAIEDKNDTLFNQTYTETINQLNWKYRPCKQLTLPLSETERPHISHHTYTQLKIFAA